MLNVKYSCEIRVQKEKVSIGDQPIYNKMYEVRPREPKKIENVILGLGGFHFSMSWFNALGKMMLNSGLEWLMIESGVAGHNIVMKGIFNNHHSPYEQCV